MAQLAQTIIQDTKTSGLSGLLAGFKPMTNAAGSESSLFSALLSDTLVSQTLPSEQQDAPLVEEPQQTEDMTGQQAKDASSDQEEAQSCADDQAREDTAQEEEAQEVARPVLDFFFAQTTVAAGNKTQADGAMQTEQTAPDEGVADPMLALQQAQTQQTGQAETNLTTTKADEDALSLQAAADSQLAAQVIEKQDSLSDDNLALAALMQATVSTTPVHKVQQASTQGVTQAVNADLSAELPDIQDASRQDKAGLQALTQDMSNTADDLQKTSSDAADAFASIMGQTTSAEQDQTAQRAQAAPQNAVAEAFRADGQKTNTQNALLSAIPVVQMPSTTMMTTAPSSSLDAMAIQGVEGASSTSATQTPAAVTANAGPSGSYDFASQLSAARVTKGGSTGLPQAVEQVAVQVHKAVKDGVNEITVKLRPAELGSVEVRLEIDADNKVTGTVVADSQTTLNMLQKDSSSLHYALQEAGLQADPGCLQFSLRDENSGGQFAQNQSQGNSNGSTSSASLDSESLTDMVVAEETYYLAPGRVNLKI